VNGRQPQAQRLANAFERERHFTCSPSAANLTHFEAQEVGQ